MAKKKKDKDVNIDSLVKEYDYEIKMLKAKQKRLEGLIQEAQLYIEELREMKEEFANMTRETLADID